MKTTPSQTPAQPATHTPKHTPPPWVINSDGNGKPFAIVTSTHDKDGPDDDVCEVYGGNGDDDDTREANARLIAAAPAMLEALREALAYVQSQPDAPQGSIAEVAQCGVRHVLKQAIAKAEGRL